MNRKKIILVLATAAVIVILDHVTKWLIVANIPLGGEIPIISGFFDIVHGRNTGAAFGFLNDWHSPLRNWFFYGIGIVAAVFLYRYLITVDDQDKISQFSLGLILGGASGNIIDRAMRGSVVDFLSVHINHGMMSFNLFGYGVIIPLTWPAFNVADAAISTAVVLLIWQNIRQGRQQQA